MEKYKEKLNKRLITLSFVAGIAAAMLFIIWSRAEALKVDTLSSNFITIIQISFFIGIYIGIFKQIKKIGTARKNEVALKALYVEENDERNKLLMEKTGSVGFNIAFTLIALATVYAGFIHSTVFFTLLCVTIFLLMIQIVLNLYYNKKF